MVRVDISRYRRQLSSFQEHMSLIDGNAARVVAKWITALDAISTDGAATKRLPEQMNQVSRSVMAFSILAMSRLPQESRPGMGEALEANVAGLVSEIKSLQEECARVDRV